MGRALRGVGVPQIPAGQPRPEPGPTRARLRRHLLLTSIRPATPLEETMGALESAVQAGKALYVGISSYGPEKTREAAALLRASRTPFIIHQPSYSMFNRWIEHGLLDVLAEEGLGCIAFSPLAQGMLTDKYLNGIPKTSRAAQGTSFDQTSSHRRQPRPGGGFERDRPATRAEPGPNGGRVGSSRPESDDGADRSQSLVTDRRGTGGPREHDRSTRRSWPRSTSTPSTATSTSGLRPATRAKDPSRRIQEH